METVDGLVSFLKIKLSCHEKKVFYSQNIMKVLFRLSFGIIAIVLLLNVFNTLGQNNTRWFGKYSDKSDLFLNVRIQHTFFNNTGEFL